jgi:hypothetical protein
MTTGGSGSSSVASPEQEVDRQAHGSEQSPHHPDQVDPGRSAQVEHHRQPRDRHGRADDGKPPGTLAVAQPQPADH